MNKPRLVSHTENCAVASATALAEMDGTIYRGRIQIVINAIEREPDRVIPSVRWRTLTMDEAMALRDLLSRTIHCALSLTADLNTRKP